MNKINGKKIYVARTFPSNFEEAIKYWGSYMPRNVQALFFCPSDPTPDAPLEEVYLCPDCNLWIEGRPLRMRYEDDLLLDDKSYPVCEHIGIVLYVPIAPQSLTNLMK